jgi:EmrB/QacA subfamily drug resistance transporter
VSSNEVQPGYLLSRRATLLAFSGLMLGVLLASLNQMIVVTALPAIVGDLGGIEHYSWLVTVYILGSTVTVPIWGRTSDIYGRRLIFVVGIVLFLVSAVISATAGSLGQLIAGRAVQGCASGALVPVAMAAVGDMIPARDRGRWQGLLGAVLGLASVIGPLIGGWISDHANWRWVFLVSIPVALIALVVGCLTLRIPRHPERAARLDALGAALLAGVLTGVLLGIVRFGENGGGVDAGVLIPSAAAAVMAVALAFHERRTPEPIIPFELLRNRTFNSANLAAFSIGAPMFGAIAYVPLYAQGALGASATSSGLVLMPLMFSWFAVSILSGQIISRTGRYRRALISGPPLMLAGYGLLATLDSHSSIRTLTVATIVIGIGLGLLYQNLVLVGQNAVPSRYMGTATGAAQLFRNAGGTIGVSVMGAVLAAGLAGGTISAAAATSGATPAAREAVAHALHPIFLIVVPVLLAACWFTWRIPELPLRRSVRDDVATSATTAPAALSA